MIKTQKNEWKWRNLHRWQKFYTAAGTDGTDKFQLCLLGLIHVNVQLVDMVYIFCWVFGFDGKDGCSRWCSSLSIAFQANWAPANWVPAYWAPANQAPRICWCDKLSPFILIIQGLNLPHQHFPWVQFEGLNLPKNWQTGPQKVLGPICHQISEGPNFLELFLDALPSCGAVIRVF